MKFFASRYYLVVVLKYYKFWFKMTCMYAAENGHLELLKWVRMEAVALY